MRIKDLPGGQVYLVRINVLDRQGRLLFSTPPIRANEEKVKVFCDGIHRIFGSTLTILNFHPQISPLGSLSAPRTVRNDNSGVELLSFNWEQPECGEVQQYDWQLIGDDDWANYDVRTGRTSEATVAIRHLLPGTAYIFKVRPVGPDASVGPWAEEDLRISTEGSGKKSVPLM